MSDRSVPNGEVLDKFRPMPGDSEKRTCERVEPCSAWTRNECACDNDGFFACLFAGFAYGRQERLPTTPGADDSEQGGAR